MECGSQWVIGSYSKDKGGHMNDKEVDKIIEVLRSYFWQVKQSWRDNTSTKEELDFINELCKKVEKLRLTN